MIQAADIPYHPFGENVGSGTSRQFAATQSVTMSKTSPQAASTQEVARRRKKPRVSGAEYFGGT
jgi:hypothetical protein